MCTWARASTSSENSQCSGCTLPVHRNPLRAPPSETLVQLAWASVFFGGGLGWEGQFGEDGLERAGEAKESPSCSGFQGSMLSSLLSPTCCSPLSLSTLVRCGSCLYPFLTGDDSEAQRG